MNKYEKGVNEALKAAELYMVSAKESLAGSTRLYFQLKLAIALVTAVVLALHEIAAAIREK